MVRSSTVRIEADLRWQKAKVWSPIGHAKPVQLPIFEPSVKHKIAPGKEFRICRKRERYTVVIVEFLGYLHSLNTMLDGVIAHSGRAGAIRMEISGQRIGQEASSATAMEVDGFSRQPYWELFTISLDSRNQIRCLLRTFSRILLRVHGREMGR